MTDTAQKLLDFSKFITLLTGEMGVDVTTSDHPRQGALVLPALDGLSEQDLDVLYGLCVREVGHLARSKKLMSDVKELTTMRAIQAANLVEQARVEKYLGKALGGGKEILDEQFSKHAFLPRYQQAVLGIHASEAQVDDVFLYALKWHLSGRPRWGWEKLFDRAAWDSAVDFLSTNPPSLSLPLRKFADSVQLSRQAMAEWMAHVGRQDNSSQRPPSKKEASWEKAASTVSASISNLAQKHQLSIDALMHKSEQYAQSAASLESAQESSWAQDLQTAQQFQEQLNGAMKGEEAVDKIKEVSKQEQSAIKDFQKADKAVLKQEQRVSVPQSRAAQTKHQALSEKISEVQSRLDEQLQKLDTQLQALQSKELDLISKLQNPKLSPAQQDRLNERMAQVSDRMQEVNQNKEQASNMAAQKMDELASKLEKVDQLSTFAEQQHQQRLDDLDQKRATRDAAAQALQAHQTQRALLEEQLKAVMQNQGLDIAGPQQWKEHVSNLRQQLGETLSRVQEGQSEVRALRDQSKDFSRQARDLNRQAQWEVHQQLQKVEEALAAQGIDVSLTEKMERMEGWDEANTAQAQFDAKASQELKMSVINGCGGGRGTRDMMLQINHALTQIAEVDPSLIFKDVAKTSPLSSWSSVKKAAKGQSAAQPSSSKNHMVWSRQYDRVLTATRRPVELGKLRQKYKKEIAAIRALFLKHWKPSFKPKFIGGREEGDLDSRNLWKLASNQGNDFFEVVKKRPNFQSCATILVDVSGSCAAWGSDVDDASQSIQGLVLLLSEGLSAVNIPHEILTYCAPVDERLSTQIIPAVYNRKSCRLDTTVIKSFKDKDCAAVPAISIQQADNSDGESVRVALQRLVKQSPRQKMMFLISDGKPFMQDSDSDLLDEDLLRALKECAAHNVTVAGLGLSKNHQILGSSYWGMSGVSDLPQVLSQQFFTTVKP